MNDDEMVMIVLVGQAAGTHEMRVGEVKAIGRW